MTPLYTHDCSRCTFIGSASFMNQDVDVYLSCDASSDMYIVRYNSEGSEYATIGLGSAMYKRCKELHDKHDTWTVCGSERFNISSDELSKLKCACAVMKLDWRAQAARPAIARKLIAMYKAGLPEIVSPGIF